MARSTVLIIDSDRRRRHELSQGFAARGFEAIRSSTIEEGLRFATAIRPALLMLPISMTGLTGNPILGELAQLSSQEKPIQTVLLGNRPSDLENLPDTIIFLPMGGLTLADLVDRVSLVLVGTEVGVVADASLKALVGDLAMVPLLELVRSLGRAWVTGRLELEKGLVHLARGRVISARSGTVRGLKAFCRLGRFNEGPFRVLLGQVTVPRDIDIDMNALVIAAIDDSLAEIPDPRSQLQVIASNALTHAPLSLLQRQILAASREEPTLRHVLNRVPETDGRVVDEILHMVEMGFLQQQVPHARGRIITDSTADLP